MCDEHVMTHNLVKELRNPRHFHIVSVVTHSCHRRSGTRRLGGSPVPMELSAKGMFANLLLLILPCDRRKEG